MTEQPPNGPDLVEIAGVLVAAGAAIGAWIKAGRSNTIAADGLLKARDAAAEARRANRLSGEANAIASRAAESANAAVSEARRANSLASDSNLIAKEAAQSSEAAVDEARRSADMAERSEARQSRPYVFAQLRPGLAGLGTWDLVLSNSGSSSARNLTIECPEMPDEEDQITGPLRRFFAGEQTLPPGASLRTYWSINLPAGHTFKDGSTDPVGMPKRATLAIRYTSDDPLHPSFRDTFRIDEDGIGLTPAPADGHEAPDGLDQSDKNLHKMLAAIARNIGEGNR